MIYTWETKDIVGGVWARSTLESCESPLCIAYDGLSQGKVESLYGVVSIATDGLFLRFDSKQVIVDLLNKGEYKPLEKPESFK